ncbi:interferon alpha-inducible protein 27, mitochondrial-like [Mytilus trossulus]|uniref:interferon alpha-inducible protein 27, mitochondrial-like n=1 Tax=Mytilus trossulus TaxID=6551 RepID=UPI0030072856
MEKKISVIVFILLIAAPGCYAWSWGGVLTGAVCMVAAPIAIPAALGTVGFSAAGIVGSSIAASAMSASSPVVTGSLVAMAQSVGATGTIGLATKAVAAGVGYGTYCATHDCD